MEENLNPMEENLNPIEENLNPIEESLNIDIIEGAKNSMVRWAEAAKGHINETGEIYGYSWGDPNLHGGELGDYRKIRDEYVIPNCLSGTVIDLGALSGKWTQYMRFADRVIYADIDKNLWYITKNLIHIDMEFHQCNGYDLCGIEDSSVDFILTMDSFMRADKLIIESYAKDIKRVLKPSGKAVIMLPLNTQSGSIARGFTDLSIDYVKNLFDGVKYKIDTDTITHGCLVLINF